MRRAGNLWGTVTSFDNLFEAARSARKGKRYGKGSLAFDHDLEGELTRLRCELESGIWRPGPHRTFEIFEPKRRLISAAPYRDRVVHHALCRVVGPVFERGFVAESFANRVGFGTHRALAAFTRHLRSSKYVLQADVVKFYPSVDHEILKGLIRRRIKCPETLWLMDTIIDGGGGRGVEPCPAADADCRGLPIGNLTSQLFGNLYLDGVDHLVKQGLRCRRYVRFVDDLAVFGDDAEWLREIRRRIEEAAGGLRLELHPVKTQIRATVEGASFLGFRVSMDGIRVRSDNLRRGRRRLRRMGREYASGRLSPGEVTASVRSWFAHLAHGDTLRLRERIADGLVFVARGDVPVGLSPRCRAPAESGPEGSGLRGSVPGDSESSGAGPSRHGATSI